MIKDPSLDMSFSGLKTAVLYEVQDLKKAGGFTGLQADLAASFQAAVVEVLIEKSLRACARTSARTLLVAGGVARNRALRENLVSRCNTADIKVIFPPLNLCTDNAAMVARTALFHFRNGRTDSLDIRAYATGSLDWPSASS